jgi:hypothetical protein
VARLGAQVACLGFTLPPACHTPFLLLACLPLTFLDGMSVCST